MILFFHHTLDALRLTPLEAFQTSYLWRFSPSRMPDLSTDFCQYTLHGLLPQYTVAWLQHLERTTK